MTIQLRVLCVALLSTVMMLTVACTGPTGPTSVPSGGGVAGPQLVTYIIDTVRIDRVVGESGSSGNRPIFTHPQLQPLSAGVIKVNGVGITGGVVEAYLFTTQDLWDGTVHNCFRLNQCSKALAGPIEVVNGVSREVGTVSNLATPSQMQLIYFVRGEGYVGGAFLLTITGEMSR